MAGENGTPHASGNSPLLMPESRSARLSDLKSGCCATLGGQLNAPGSSESDWTDLLALMHQYGKEGPSQLWLELIPYWSQSQRLNGGVPCPDALQPDWIAEIKAENNCKKSAHAPVTRPKNTTRKAPGAPRKPRSDAGKTRTSYKTRTPKTLS
jgi:hypothetical protein